MSTSSGTDKLSPTRVFDFTANYLPASQGGPPCLEVALPTGDLLALRMATPEDREELVRGFERLSPSSRYTRFFTPMRSLSGPVLHQLADLSGYRHVAIAAFRTEGNRKGQGVGVARAIQTNADAPAELAVTVVDEAQGNGLGELLLRVVVAVTLESGVDNFVASVLHDNGAAIRTFAKLGAHIRHDPDDPSISMVELRSSELSLSSIWSTQVQGEVRKFAVAVAV